MQLASDLGLALALASAPARLADDHLKDAGERDPLQPGDLRRDGAGLADGGAEGDGLTIGQLQNQPVDRRADGCQVTELAAPQLPRNAAKPRDRLQDEVADG